MLMRTEFIVSSKYVSKLYHKYIQLACQDLCSTVHKIAIQLVEID